MSGPSIATPRPARRAPLTAARQDLALSAEAWLWQELRGVPFALVRVFGRDTFEQEARVAAAKAAADFDPAAFPGVPFGAFARRGVRLHLRGVVARLAMKFPVWREMPADPAGGSFPDPADHRPAGGDPALRAWCSDDYRDQRRCLDWRTRVLLYLRTVEGWTLDEVAAPLGVSRERVRQLETKAAQKLARYRNRRVIRRQLEGRAS